MSDSPSPFQHSAASQSGHATPALQHQPNNDVPFSRPGTPSRHDAHQIGWVGLGAMGYFMSRNLAVNRHSHPTGSPPVLVHNRTVAKSEKLVKEVGENKARVAQSPGQIALECDVIFTNLASDEVVEKTYKEFAAALTEHKPTKNKIFVETSTIHPLLAGKLDSLINQFPHCHFIASPVFGPPTSADKSQLIVVMAGDYRSKKEVAHLMVPSIGRKVYDVGGNIEKAPTFKLIGNSMILGCLEIMSEAFTLGEKSGVGQDMVLKLLKDLLPAPPLVAYGEKIVNNAFDGSKGFAIDGGIKDATHIRNMSTTLSCPMPAIDIAHQHLLTARSLHQAQVAAGTARFETLDWSSIVVGSRVAAGLDALDTEKHHGVVKDDD